MGKCACSPRHFPGFALHPMVFILFSSHSETSPKEETCSFQADALYKKKMYETEFTKRKREKNELFILEVGKLVVVTVENQTSPITKEKCWW